MTEDDRCSNSRRRRGLVYPRTCQICGLGLCKVDSGATASKSCSAAMTVSMVERVAAYLQMRDEYLAPGEADDDERETSAREIVGLMRNPTDAMVDAGVTADFGKTLGERVINSHNAMIDAALNEQVS